MSTIQQFLFGSSVRASLWTSLALLLLRLHIGLSIMGAGKDKLPVPDWLVEQVTETGFPFPAFFAYLSVLAQFAGGLLIVIGLFTRPAAITLAFTMGVAAFLFHGVTPFLILHITQVLFWSYLLVAFAGGGRFALDQWVLAHSPPTKARLIPAWTIALALIGYSAAIQLTREPRQPTTTSASTDEIMTMNLAGTFNDWDVEAMSMTEQPDGTWQTTLAVTDPGPLEFKFAANGSWDLNAGESDQSSDTLPIQAVAESNQETEPANIRAAIPSAGSYLFTIHPNSLVYTVTKLAAKEDLLGEWQVDLRPTPDAAPYYQTLTIQSIDGGKITGQFYDSEIQHGQLNTQWNTVQATLITSDGSADYHTTLKLANGQLEGTTHAPARDLFSIWTAARSR